MSAHLPFRIAKLTGSFMILMLVLISSGCNLGGNGNPTPPGANFWYVSPSGKDSNDCKTTGTACRTIGAAISKAADQDSIFLAAGTYQEQVTISKSISISGSGSQASEVVLDGNHQFQVLSAGCMACSLSIQVSNLVIQNGFAPSSGGFTGAAGVSVNGATLTMSNVVIQNNEAGPHGYGIAGGVYIYSNATLNMSDSTITGNTNNNDDEQGKMYNGNGSGINNAGTLNLTSNVTISNNINDGNGQGGGIYTSGSLVMNGGTIQNNRAGGGGGGLYSTGTTSLTGVLIDGNDGHNSGGGIYQAYGRPSTRLTATDITVTNNQATLGAGVYNEFTMDEGLVAILAYLEIKGSTIAYNQGVTGAGILNTDRANMYLINDTISNNQGGGIATGNGEANGRVLNVTIAYNQNAQGAGILTGGGNLELQNVLLAKNAGGNCSTAYGGAISSYAGNLSDDVSCNFQSMLDQNNVDPKIGQLSLNNGSTQTIALKPGSPAIDAALQFLAPQSDQLGAPRGGDGNGDGIPGVDIGALEVIPNTQGMSLQTTIVPVTATLSSDIFTIIQAADCRSGPGTAYPARLSLPVGAAPSALARNGDGSWIFLYQPGQSFCWSLASAGRLTGELASLPVQADPPTLIPSVTPVITDTPTPVITDTPTLAALTFTPGINANCRSGPGRIYAVVDVAMGGKAYLLDGRNLANSWVRIMLSPINGCWLDVSIGKASGDTKNLRVLIDPPTPTPSPTAVPLVCSAFTDRSSCDAHGCTWHPAASAPGTCGP
jgi:hypothetical protein